MDLTVVAVPGYFATMGAEYLYLRRRAERLGQSPADYERNDTITSLTMGVGSLLAPVVMPKLLGPLTPGEGRYAKALLAGAAGAVAVTTLADALARLEPADAESATTSPTARDAGVTDMDATSTGPTSGSSAEPDSTESEPRAAVLAGSAPERRASRRARRRSLAAAARKVAAVGGVASVVAGGIAITTAFTSRTRAERLWRHRALPDLGTGPLALAAAVVGWDFVYYWNHRFMHEARYLWAIHVVHHSSEHYNLSTALRQPVADAFGTFVPYGALSLLGIRPEMILQARALNLLYQYWIHTDAIRRLGPFEEVLNTPSHHRVHHGSNRQYLDRNHGSILISWDRLFGTFEREDEPVVYGLTRNIDTFNPVKVATHEHADMLRDVARSTTWRDRFSFVVRGPGWAYARRAEQDALSRSQEVPTRIVAGVIAGTT